MKAGRLIVDEPGLPDGNEVELAVVDPGDDLDDGERVSVFMWCSSKHRARWPFGGGRLLAKTRGRRGGTPHPTQSTATPGTESGMPSAPNARAATPHAPCGGSRSVIASPPARASNVVLAASREGSHAHLSRPLAGPFGVARARPGRGRPDRHPRPGGEPRRMRMGRLRGAAVHRLPAAGGSGASRTSVPASPSRPSRWSSAMSVAWRPSRRRSHGAVARGR